MPQFEPSLLQQLGPENVEGFGKAIGNILKPNFEFQQAMHKAIAGNPKLAQEFRDLEANAPGTLSAMGFGAVGDVINMMPESQENEFSRKNRGEIIDKEKQKLDIQHSEQGITIQRLNDTVKLLQDNPAVRSDAILSSLGLGSAAQRAKAALDLQVTQAKAPAEIAKAKSELEAYNDIIAKAPHLQEVNFPQLARDFDAGKPVGGAIAMMLSGIRPGTKEAMEQAMRAVAEEKVMANERYMAALRNDNTKENLVRREAFTSWNSTHAGTLEAWETVISNPQKVEELKSKTTPLTQSEKDILAAANAQKQGVIHQQYSVMSKVMADRRKAENELFALEKADRPIEDKLQKVDELNMALAAQADITGKRYTAHYGEIPGGEHMLRSNEVGLWYSDDSGKRVENAKVQEVAKSKAELLSALGLEELNAYSAMSKMSKEEQKSQLERMQKMRPDVYKRLSPLFDQ
jgi:hypothetical protein